MGKFVFPIAEIFNSFQGEGVNSGSLAVFVRFAGCNLSCEFCDTDHSKTFEIGYDALMEKIIAAKRPLVVFTGGEPLLYPIEDLVLALIDKDIDVNIETNGTQSAPDWLHRYISLSPKVPREECKAMRCRSLKLLYPYLPAITAEDWDTFYFTGERYLQPIATGDPIVDQANIMETINELERLNSKGMPWRLGLQQHKLIGAK